MKVAISHFSHATLKKIQTTTPEKQKMDTIMSKSYYYDMYVYKTNFYY